MKDITGEREGGVSTADWLSVDCTGNAVFVVRARIRVTYGTHT